MNNIYKSDNYLLDRAVHLLLFSSVVLLPIQRLELPLNIALFDILNVFAVLAYAFYIGKYGLRIHWPQLIPLWMICLGSLGSTMVSPDYLASLVIIMQELYLYLWIIFLIPIFLHIPESTLHRFYACWLLVAIAHGLLIIAQAASPDFLQMTTAFVGKKYGALGSPRPLGLFKNPNIAADFQVFAFLPLFLLRISPYRSIVVAILLVASIAATGSLGASVAVICAGLFAFGLYQITSNRLFDSAKYFFYGALVLVLLTATIGIIFLLSPDSLDKFQSLYIGRFDGSSGKRFLLWQQGLSVSRSILPVWGIGPGIYQDSILNGVGLHNDLISFWVERGFIATLGLLLLFLSILWRPLKIIMNARGENQNVGDLILLFSLGLVALVQSQTHEIFHFRTVWLFIAIWEVICCKMTNETNSSVSAMKYSGKIKIYKLSNQNFMALFPSVHTEREPY